MGQKPDNIDEAERASRRAELIKKRKRRKAFVMAVFSLIAVAIFAVLILFVVFRVRSFTISADSELAYESSEISEASGVKIGANIFNVDCEAAAESIQSELPYCDSVVVTKRYPSTLVIKVKRAKEVYSVISGDGTYAVTDENLKVLELTGEMPQGSIIVEGCKKTSSLKPGENVCFVNDTGDDPVRTALSETAEAVSENDMKEISYVNVSDRGNIYIIYDGRIIIRIGNTSDVIKKLSLAKKALEEENKLSSSQFGEMNVRETNKAVFSPEDYKDMTELIAYNELLKTISYKTETEENAEPEQGEDESATGEESETEETDTEPEARMYRCDSEDGVNVRSGPGSSYDSIGSLETDDEVEGYETQESEDTGKTWLKIKMPDGTYGWVAESFMTEIDEY